MTVSGHAWRVLNLLVTIAALGFLAWAIVGTGALAAPAWRDPALLAAVGLAGCIYAAALSFVVAGWLSLVRSAGGDAVLTARTGFRIYGLSQLYKYLPSNLLHYIGRHAALRRIGIGHLAAALGGLGEIALLVPAALFVAAVAGLAGGMPLSGRIGTALAVALAGVAVSAAATAAALPRLRRHPRTADLVRAVLAPPVRWAAVRAFACYLAFFVCSSAAFTLLASAAGAAQAGVLSLFAIWSSAWVLGFVVPGAPGGIGVREAVLIAGLSPAIGLDGAALVALAMRLATVVGDLLLAAAAYFKGTEPKPTN